MDYANNMICLLVKSSIYKQRKNKSSGVDRFMDTYLRIKDLDSNECGLYNYIYLSLWLIPGTGNCNN